MGDEGCRAICSDGPMINYNQDYVFKQIIHH